MSRALHYENDGPRCGKNGETTTKKSLVTCGNCRKAMKKRTDYRKQADILFSRLIRQRDGFCLHSGSSVYLQCAHILPRTYHSIRVDPRNAIALSQASHVFFTHRPLEWRAWVEEQYPGRWDHLSAIALTYQKVNWREELERLKAWEKQLASDPSNRENPFHPANRGGITTSMGT